MNEVTHTDAPSFVDLNCTAWSSTTANDSHCHNGPKLRHQRPTSHFISFSARLFRRRMVIQPLSFSRNFERNWNNVAKHSPQHQSAQTSKDKVRINTYDLNCNVRRARGRVTRLVCFVWLRNLTMSVAEGTFYSPAVNDCFLFNRLVPPFQLRHIVASFCLILIQMLILLFPLPALYIFSN